MRFNEEYLSMKLGKHPERITKIKKLTEDVINRIVDEKLTLEEVKIFHKVLGSTLAEYQERAIRTFPFVVLPDNFQGEK